MAIIVPNAGSTLVNSGCIPGSEDKWAWIGFQTQGASGSMCWYSTNTCTSGCELIAISLPAQQQVLFGPFNSPCGLYAAGIVGGCALIQMKR